MRRKLRRVCILVCALFAAPTVLQASITIVSSFDGQAAAAVNYLDLRSLAPQSGVGLLANHTSGSFDPHGSTMVNLWGDAEVRRLRPSATLAYRLSGDHSPGGIAGDPQGIVTNGQSLRHYFAVGATSGSQAELVFAEGQRYLGLLWGSVEVGNTLTFHFTDNTSQSIFGSQINPQATGMPGVAGSFFVNFAADKTFDRVVASSVDADFEFGNLAFSPRAILVPESSTMAIWSLLGLLAIACRAVQLRPAGV